MARFKVAKKARLAGATVGLGLLFFGDGIFPGPWTPPLEPRPPQRLDELLPRLPKRNVGRFGRSGDPLSLVFLGNEEQVRSALREAGWIDVPLRIPTSLRRGFWELLRERRLTLFPPMNLYRVEGRVQDLNWSITVVPILRRHHFRLWKTSWRDGSGREVWWGCANFDQDVRWRDLSHVPDPDNDGERNYIAATLSGSRWVEKMDLRRLPQLSLKGSNDKGYPFYTDGKALIVSLRSVVQ